MSSFLEVAGSLFLSLYISSAFASPLDSFEGQYEVISITQKQIVLELGDIITIQSFSDSAQLSVKNLRTSNLSYSVNMTQYENYQGEGRWDVAAFVFADKYNDSDVGWVGGDRQIYFKNLKDGLIRFRIHKQFYVTSYYTDEAILKKLR